MALAQVLCSYPMRVSSLISPYIGSTSGPGSAVGETFGEGAGGNDRLPLRLWLWAWIYVKAREAQPSRTEAGGGTGEGAGRSTSTSGSTSGWILEGMLTHGSCGGSETWILQKCTVEDSQTWILQRT